MAQPSPYTSADPYANADEMSGTTRPALTRTVGLEWVWYPVVVAVVHFVIVQGTATLAFLYGTVRDDPGNLAHGGAAESGPSNMHFPASIPGFLGDLIEPMRSWDGLWYKEIADLGYHAFATANPAYWPLMPWIMEYGARLTGQPSEVIGWLTANVFFVVALIFVYRIVLLDFSARIARLTLWALALFPMALFFSAIYTESLFLMLAAGALYFARTRAWALAGVLGLLAALTRSQGVMLLLPFLVLFVQQYSFAPRRWLTTGLANGLFASLPIFGPILFYLYLDHENIPQTVRNPAFVAVQAQWARFSAWPWETIRCSVSACYAPPGLTYQAGSPTHYADWSWLRQLIDNPSWSHITSFQFRDMFARSDTVELVSLILFVGLAIVGLRILPLYMSAYLLLPLLFPLFQPSAVHPLFSYPRFGIVLFPLFIVLAVLLERRSAFLTYCAVSTVLLVLFTIQFAHWYWVS